MSIGLKSNEIELIVGTDVELCFMYDVNVWEIISEGRLNYDTITVTNLVLQKDYLIAVTSLL